MVELDYITEFPQEIIATDEVGRGPLSGPVVAGAVRVVVNSQDELRDLLYQLKNSGIKDSKKLSSIQRGTILEELGIKNLDFRKKNIIQIQGHTLHYLTWEISEKMIDEENILRASLRGMKEASTFLSQPINLSTTVFIDGPKAFGWGKDSSPWTEIPLIKGDSRSLLIGLAALCAKEKRDHFMRQMHELYPFYGFNSHFGYPTAKHRQAIEKYGPCPIHRKTFKGVKEFLRS